MNQPDALQRVNPFALNLAASSTSVLFRPLLSLAERAASSFCGLPELTSLYQVAQKEKSAAGFATDALRALGISYSVSPDNSAGIPVHGPAIIVANYPFGGLEGLILLDLVRRIRPDVKAMANYLLGRIPELHSSLILVDPAGSKSAARRNHAALRSTISWVQSGGVLVVFPSGTVSHFQWSTRDVSDPRWDPSIARIIRMTNAPVVPVFFHGCNALLFQLLGLVCPRLRTLQIPRQFVNKRGTELRLEIGTQVTPQKLQTFSSEQELIAYLRVRTYLLKSRVEVPKGKLSAFCRSGGNLERKVEPIIDPVDSRAMAQEVAVLPEQQIIVQQGSYTVAFAYADQIPSVLREIGRLREVTFRAANEGTGKSIDLDRFDNYYLHLFAWNKAKQEIIGAYRLVDANYIRKTMGVNGLYTSTLFAYRENVLEQMGEALELGRSFVRQEYQRNFNSLHLLWKGITLYVARNPRYYGLFGTVSISSDYDSLSCHLIVSFLRENKYIPELARLIHARNPVRRRRLPGVDKQTASVVVNDMSDVTELIAEIEAKNKGLPILLRQYLKLNGRLLGFNMDKSFGNVLDGLIYVDMRETERTVIERYMGSSEFDAYLRYHGRRTRLDRTGTSG